MIPLLVVGLGLSLALTLITLPSDPTRVTFRVGSPPGAVRITFRVGRPPGGPAVQSPLRGRRGPTVRDVGVRSGRPRLPSPV